MLPTVNRISLSPHRIQQSSLSASRRLFAAFCDEWFSPRLEPRRGKNEIELTHFVPVKHLLQADRIHHLALRPVVASVPADTHPSLDKPMRGPEKRATTVGQPIGFWCIGYHILRKLASGLLHHIYVPLRRSARIACFAAHGATATTGNFLPWPNVHC